MVKVLMCLWFALLMACDESAVEKCDTLIDELCDRGVQCIPTNGSHAQCVQAIQQELPCGSAKDVSPSYDRCIDQVQSMSCASLFPNGQIDLPADCEAVILVSRVTAEESASTTPWSAAMSVAYDE